PRGHPGYGVRSLAESTPAPDREPRRPPTSNGAPACRAGRGGDRTGGRSLRLVRRGPTSPCPIPRRQAPGPSNLHTRRERDSLGPIGGRPRPCAVVTCSRPEV